jgi:LmbE family N-acetylglucosaminyl deacetylase
MIKNLLFIGAHPDDLEVMAGGTVKRVINEGGNVHALIVSDGTWVGPNSEVYRDAELAKLEAVSASKIIGHSIDFLDEKTLEISYKDSVVVSILKCIDKIKADTIICPWVDDLHQDHSEVARMAIAASRKVPRVLMAQANWYVANGTFTPNIFFDISDTYDDKMQALECYESEMKRTGETWRVFHDSLTRYYGLISSCERAEGFLTHKYRF